MTSLDHPRDTVPDRLPWAEAAAACLMALVVTAGHALLDQQPLFWDEYYHLLAGRAWATDGTLSIGAGDYPRAGWLSTWVGWMFRTFGEGVTQARLAPAIVHAASIFALFAWVHRRAGRLTAWAAAAMLAVAPVVLVNAVMVRFYGVAGLFVLLCAIGLDHANREEAPGKWRLLALTVAVAFAWLAFRTTPLTRVWLSGLLVWFIGATVVHAIRSKHRAALLAALAIFGSASLFRLWSTGWISGMWAFYREAPGWDIDRADDIAWYARTMRDQYPTLLTLFPLAAVVSLLKRPRFGSLCLTAFVVGFLVLSGAGAKAERYLIPILPFFFTVWGMALAELLPSLWRWTVDAVGRTPGVAPMGWPKRILPPLMVTGVIGFVLVTNPGFASARQWAHGGLPSLDRPPPTASVSPTGWDELADELRALIDDVEVVVTANTLQMLYHVGSYDYGMRPTVIGELSPPREFGTDLRDGRPAISTLESLIEIVDGHSSGLIVGERWRWSSRTEGFTPDVAAFVYETMEEVSFPGSRGLIVYRWDRRSGKAP